MRVRTSSSALPRSIRPQETPTSAHLGDAKERPCSRRRHGRRGGPAHLAKGRRGAPFRPRSPQSFSEDSASHWVHVQTSTSIDSSVSTLCLRTRVATGPQPRSAGLALTDTLLRVVLVRADTTFRAGVVESDRETEGSPPERRAGPIQKFGGSSLHRNVFASERGRTEQLESLRAPLERAVVRLKSWKIIRHDDE